MRAGDIVRATAGKDKEKVFLVLSTGETDALIVNGRRRKVQRPKRKSLKHLVLVQEATLPPTVTNKTVKKLLQPFYSQHKEEN